jgi:hypothetical protein
MLAAAVLNAFVAAFAGTWSCAPDTGNARPATRWTIAAVPRATWARVTSTGRSGGTAYVGYLPYQGVWTYEDFRDDGTFVSTTSPGPQHGVWIWNGAVTTADGITHVTVEWRRAGTTIRRAVGRSIGPSFRASARDVCRALP